jgi:alpha-ketoglutarate-dependent taurine dioxygenase
MRYSITPLTPHTGAEVRGLDLNQAVDAETRVALNHAFVEHHVLVIQRKYEYRHQWHYGDFVIWDNRSVIHKANPDYDMNERRYLYRLMLKGEPPV